MKIVHYRNNKFLWGAIVFLSVTCLNTIYLSKITHFRCISQEEAILSGFFTKICSGGVIYMKNQIIVTFF